MTPGDREAAAAHLAACAEFALDRIDELEWADDGYADLVRDWMGHVDPALSRLRWALEQFRTDFENTP